MIRICFVGAAAIVALSSGAIALTTTQALNSNILARAPEPNLFADPLATFLVRQDTLAGNASATVDPSPK
jgi:hypothetical protein